MTAASLLGVGAVALIIALAASGCGSARPASGPFAWLRPATPPAGWKVVRIPGGASVAYPPGWTAIETDPGSASVALRAGGGQFLDYLNVTPKQGAETLADWSRFRPRKNGEEGDRNVRLLAATTDAHFRGGHGSCVIDSYETSITSYEEIACLVSGPRSSAVVVAAAPSRLWHERAAVLERAVSTFTV